VRELQEPRIVEAGEVVVGRLDEAVRRCRDAARDQDVLRALLVQARREPEEVRAGVRNAVEVEQAGERGLVACVALHRLAEVEHEVGLLDRHLREDLEDVAAVDAAQSRAISVRE
jgi:hypothetical protein